MKRLSIAILAAVITMAMLPLAAVALPEDSVWESYTTGDDAGTKIYGNVWAGQTFTVSPESHSISRVRLLVYRLGDPGTVTVGIRRVDDANLPTGQDITSGTFDGDNATAGTGGLWQTVTLTEVSLDYDETYAIVVRAEAGDTDNAIYIRVDETTPTYAGGNVVTSANGGGSWTPEAGDDAAFEVWGEALLDVEQGKVFSGYIETGDLLFTMQYLNHYTPYYPADDPNYHFVLQLRSADGNTVIAQTTCRAWGYMPGAIYLSADQASGLTVGTLYRLYLYGDLTEEPEAYYGLRASDWRGTDMTQLDSWVVGTAKSMADYYDYALTTTVVAGSDEVLNELAGVIFSRGIPRLETQRTHIFEVTIWGPDYEHQAGRTDFDDATDWQSQVGDTAADTIIGVGNIWGISGRNMGAFGLLIGYAILCVVIVGRGGEAFGAALLGVPIVMLGTWLGLLDISHITIIAAVGILLTVYRFWFART